MHDLLKGRYTYIVHRDSAMQCKDNPTDRFEKIHFVMLVAVKSVCIASDTVEYHNDMMLAC